ncbi:hypothetical protein [Novosphingobium sediminicola]|uniref:DnaT DNA-binding domain-containing protein n=1 Tax=Novosphingobium sediminicola TaxID=563162 RepID=A0A7W6G7F5_9SPHN|nr:hypothetical protein [Novosphingobium sediminicola]MBB3956859.1 hypothetical protein [Novosphingobium sediminicola]
MSDLLARLIAAGTPADLVAEVAMEIARADVVRRQEAEDAARKEKKRADNARRQREFKERNRPPVTQGNADNALPALVAVTCVTSPALSPSPNEINSNPHPHTHPETNTARTRGTRLPVDWVPEPLTGDLAKAIAQWPPGALERELARFRDWAASTSGPNAVKKDWQAAWRNWLRKAHDEGRYLKHGNQDRNQNRWSASGQPSGTALGQVLRDKGVYADLGFDG